MEDLLELFRADDPQGGWDDHIPKEVARDRVYVVSEPSPRGSEPFQPAIHAHLDERDFEFHALDLVFNAKQLHGRQARIAIETIGIGDKRPEGFRVRLQFVDGCIVIFAWHDYPWMRKDRTILPMFPYLMIAML